METAIEKKDYSKKERMISENSALHPETWKHQMLLLSIINAFTIYWISNAPGTSAFIEIQKVPVTSDSRYLHLNPLLRNLSKCLQKIQAKKKILHILINEDLLASVLSEDSPLHKKVMSHPYSTDKLQSVSDIPLFVNKTGGDILEIEVNNCAFIDKLLCRFQAAQNVAHLQLSTLLTPLVI